MNIVMKFEFGRGQVALPDIGWRNLQEHGKGYEDYIYIDSRGYRNISMKMKCILIGKYWGILVFVKYEGQEKRGERERGRTYGNTEVQVVYKILMIDT